MGQLVDSEQRRAFDKAKVFLYAYRHSYAQRHADAGAHPTSCANWWARTA